MFNLYSALLVLKQWLLSLPCFSGYSTEYGTNPNTHSGNQMAGRKLAFEPMLLMYQDSRSLTP